jgi:hypothetical protein
LTESGILLESWQTVTQKRTAKVSENITIQEIFLAAQSEACHHFVTRTWHSPTQHVAKQILDLFETTLAV